MLTVLPLIGQPGVGTRNAAAISRLCHAVRLFYRLVRSQWRAGRGSRKAGRCRTGIPTPVRSATLP